jgi:hypothetical protein
MNLPNAEKFIHYRVIFGILNIEMINVLVFFTLPSGNQFKLQTVARLPLRKFVEGYSNKPYLIYGWDSEQDYYYFGGDFTPSAAALLLKEVYR